MLRKGEWVWVDSDIGVPIGARVKETPSGQHFLVDDEGKEQKLSLEQEASLRIMHPTSVEGVDDMIKLGDMTEAGLLRNLLLRHKQGLIYTYTGSVLVAVNPYKDYPIYSNDQVRLYQGRKLGELPPHIFAIAESCYFNMTRHLRNQCCIISGESGAGKTESTKLILQYLAAVSGELSEQQIEKQILESNPILEAFGNAKTIRNDNSSRFGKYLEIFFNKDGVIEGARVEQYLLEKSRVCHQALEERNYHIFYCMLAGITAEEKKNLSLGNAKEYKFLTKGDCILCEGRDDAKDYDRIHSALKILTFSEKQHQKILKLLAAILHLGNVSFEATTENNLETSDVSTSKHFSVAASLLEVPKSSLATSLTHRSFMTNKERVTKPLSSEQASDCRDALVKAIYNKLFIWIATKINSVIYKKLTNNPKKSYLSIGLLDIFGFENFEINSFEQLCINFANEKLQQFFVSHIFKLEQEEYLKEDIVWNNIKFSDNQSILDLLAGKPCNLLALIDEESHFPKGSDSTLLQKVNVQHKGSKVYIPSKSEHDTDFGICHFAGAVHYNSNGFLEKNRDAVSYDIIKMVDISTNELLHQIFENELSNNGPKMANNRKVIMTPKSSLRAKAEKRKQVPTLSGQFRQSLDSLMKALSACQPFFIRCFKPNNDKQSELFDRELCMRQLRYSGMMDTVRIRKLGYPVQHTFKDFLNRYRVLLNTTICNPKTKTAAACCEAICKATIEGKDEWKIGRNKIFLKDSHDAVLERLRETELSRVAVVIQRVMMMRKDRESFLRKRRAAVVLQKHWRAHRAQQVQRKVQRGFDRLTSMIRSRQLQLQYKRQRAAALTIQTQVRGYQARKEFKQKREALRLHQEEEDDVALELQRRLEDIAESQVTQEEPESSSESDSRNTSSSEHDSEDGTRPFQLIPPVIVVEPVSEDEMSGQEEETSFDPSELQEAIPRAWATPSPSLDEDEDEDENEFDDENDEFSFYKFSILHFQDADHKHITQRLKKSLLTHDDEADELACLTISWIILRFMEDIPEPKSADVLSQASSTMSRLVPQKQGRRLSNLVGLDQKILRRNKKKSESGNRKASTILEEPDNLTEDEDIMIGEGPTLYRQLSQLEKLHIIVGYAMSRPGIRDEIYCQICKQLVNNHNRRSRRLGWTLLSVCLGIFPPTNLFLKCLENFISKGLRDYKEYCSNRLYRVIANGERKELPCWVELQAAKSKAPIDASVTLMDGRSVDLPLESASTSAEVCQAVADQLGLKDTYGFSLYISLYEKMWSLNSCEKHVLDAVSQCEQEMRRQNKEEKDAPWRLSIRKEMFAPWHDCSLDPVSTDLIYRQVIKGIKNGEYMTDKEDECIQLAAMHYYIQFGSEYDRENVQSVVEECIPTHLIENKSMTKWIQLISSPLLQGPYARETQGRERVKGQLVEMARQKWTLDFSRFFEVTMMSGPPLPKSRFVVAVNWTGILFMERRDKRLREIPYLEVKKVSMMSENYVSAQHMTLTTFRGEFVLRSGEARSMAAVMEENVEGLRQRSVYALAQEAIKSDDPMFLVCKRGDLLLVDKDESSHDRDWIRARNERTGDSGAVYKRMIEYLPTLTKPTDAMLELLSPSQKKPFAPVNTLQEEETVAPVSLKEFAFEYFRSAGKDAGRPKGTGKEKLWASSREPLKQPLLKSLVRKSDLNHMACSAFIAIMKYMGDYPIKQMRSPMELTDLIFGPATQHKELQDEIYCQIMKQMTSNNNRLSMERGWQLLWMCTGLFPPSDNLMGHAQRFVESRRRDLLAAGCLQRLLEIHSKEPRKLPPHLAEVEAIQQNVMNIFHKVHFPNEKSDIFEVASTITIKDLCYSITSNLKLSSAEGYGLYLKTPTKMMSLEENRYFFDCLRQITSVPKKGKKVKEGSPANISTKVIFKRKLWFNVSPGKDIIADLTFHFPQEVPKYLHGFHNCTKENMITLGGLLFRAQVDSDRSQFVMIPRMLKGLVPADQLKIMVPEEWKKHIISSYNKQSGMTVQEAKITFLRTVSSWPAFGCDFYEVKQTCERSYPNPLWIGINKQGVSLIDPTSKELLVMHQFNRIIEYYSKGNSFTMTIGTLVRGNSFVCETSQADQMEDLIRSYVSMYERQIQDFRPRNAVNQLLFI
ncbi:unconventional myosin-VIIa-like isoform X2 [Amphiprion ocellaris]|uniref:unconventional myosin-VIIa-like isoform X2 n=1 Tax=Amphiprion ocellaris TaxID=80972 RepID=UPI0024113912|nr:unconventional myosin-VIIa-like isoform X2 [Amphiprion ocellaris]